MVRAKSGMSISAAIRAAPTKKLTSSAPQAGVRRSAPRGHQRAGGAAQVRARRRRRRARSRGGTRAPGRRRPAPWGRRWRRPGSPRPARAPSSSAPSRSASRSVRTQPRRSTSGRRAVQHRTTSSTSAAIAVDAERGQPAAVAGERDEELAPGEVAHQRGWAGRRPGTPATRVTRASSEADPVGSRSPGARAVGGRRTSTTGERRGSRRRAPARRPG